MAELAFRRLVLARYVDRPPHEVVFVPTEGRPRLAAAGIDISLAGSYPLALCAVARDALIGADIERIRPLHHQDRLYENTLTEREREQVASGGIDMFFRLWVCKEAVVKLTGTGMEVGLDRVEIALGSGTRAEAVIADSDQRFWVTELEMDSGYRAAAAVEDPDAAVSLRHWTWSE